MKKTIVAGVGALLLLGGGLYGIKGVSAATQTQPQVEAKAQAATSQPAGKRVQILNQYKDQLHQMNQLREERLDLQKQMVEKKDQLLDLFLAAKNSGNKEKIKQARAVRQQVNSLNREMKPLLKQSQDERKALKGDIKNGTGSQQFAKLLDTNKQINDKMKDKLAEMDKLIETLK